MPRLSDQYSGGKMIGTDINGSFYYDSPQEPISTHEKYFQKRNIGNVLRYDPTADGPEVPMIRFFSRHPEGGRYFSIHGFHTGLYWT